jgi:hypothetical protein
MERYVTYRPTEDLPNDFAAAYASGDDSGLEVRLVCRGSARTLVLRFGRVPAFRAILEECNLGRFGGEWEHPDTHTPCFIVEGSEWVSQFSKAELIHHRDPVHYCFLSDDQFVEVLSSRPPSVRWSNAG